MEARRLDNLKILLKPQNLSQVEQRTTTLETRYSEHWELGIRQGTSTWQRRRRISPLFRFESCVRFGKRKDDFCVKRTAATNGWTSATRRLYEKTSQALRERLEARSFAAGKSSRRNSESSSSSANEVNDSAVVQTERRRTETTEFDQSPTASFQLLAR